MRHEYDPIPGGMADGDLPFLVAGVIWIGKRQSQRVEENRCCFLERDTMLPPVGLCLLAISLIDHSLSLPQRARKSPRRGNPFGVAAQVTVHPIHPPQVFANVPSPLPWCERLFLNNAARTVLPKDRNWEEIERANGRSASPAKRANRGWMQALSRLFWWLQAAEI